MAHTPGKWRVRPYGGRYTSINGANIVSETGVVVARLTRVADKPIDQKEADGNLIAAAPEMCEALKQILGWRELRSGSGEIPVERIEEIARAAIAKAEGR